MYKVIYTNGRESRVSDLKAEKMILFKKQGILTFNQVEWFKNVKAIEKIRQAPNHKALMATKDMACNCEECS